MCHGDISSDIILFRSVIVSLSNKRDWHHQLTMLGTADKQHRYHEHRALNSLMYIQSGELQQKRKGDFRIGLGTEICNNVVVHRINSILTTNFKCVAMQHHIQDLFCWSNIYAEKNPQVKRLTLFESFSAIEFLPVI